MRIKYWGPVAGALFCLLAIFAGMTQLKYDLNLMEYIMFSMPLSSSERQWLSEHGDIVYGIDRGAPPLSYVDEETGQNAGLVVDYTSSLSIELGVPIPGEPMVWSDIMAGLEEGRIDTADLFVSPEREKKFAFTQPIYILRGGIAVKNGDAEKSEIRSPRDLGGKRVAVAQDDYAEEYMRVLYERKTEKPVLVKVSGIAQAVELLQSGAVDAVAGDETVIDYTLKNMETQHSIVLLDEALYEQDVTFAVRKEDRELLSILNKGILLLKKKDILTKTQEKWFGVSAPIIKDRSSSRLITRIFFAAVLILIFFYYWNVITQRKIKEKTYEIQVGKSNLRNIIDALHVCLLVTDGQGRILECNTTTETFLGSPREHILTSEISSFPALSSICEAREESGPIQFEGRYYELLSKELNSVPGTRLLTIEDVTNKTLTERRLRQQSKMIAVGQLSAGLAHEIRNPLGLIKNYLYILRRYTTDDTSRHALTVAGDSADRINSLIENLLSFSRLSGERAQRVSIHNLLAGILRLEEKRLTENKIKIEVRCPESLVFFTNEEALKIILFNLLDNAIDAFLPLQTSCPPSGPKGEPLGSPDEKRLFIQAEVEASCLHILIRDNACGIPSDELEHIFNPFFTTKDSGTGLGLYIVSSELEKLNGSISVETRDGSGTSFELTIPPSPPVSPLSPSESQDRQQNNGTEARENSTI